MRSAGLAIISRTCGLAPSQHIANGANMGLTDCITLRFVSHDEDEDAVTISCVHFSHDSIRALLVPERPDLSQDAVPKCSRAFLCSPRGPIHFSKRLINISCEVGQSNQTHCRAYPILSTHPSPYLRKIPALLPTRIATRTTIGPSPGPSILSNQIPILNLSASLMASLAQSRSTPTTRTPPNPEYSKVIPQILIVSKLLNFDASRCQRVNDDIYYPTIDKA